MVRRHREADYVVALCGFAHLTGLPAELEVPRLEERGHGGGRRAGAAERPAGGVLNDHPTTVGYPVIGVVVGEDLAVWAQLRPGDEVTLRVV